MDFVTEYEQSLEKELLHCQSRYALCQEVAWQATSEMTHWQQREEELASDLERLREAHELFSQKPDIAHQPSRAHYTSGPANVQGGTATAVDFVRRQNYQKARESSSSPEEISLERQLQSVTPCAVAHRHTREEVKM